MTPRIAITLGDPAGVGPEVTLKALRLFPPRFRRSVILLGPASFYDGLARELKIGLGRLVCCFPGELPCAVRRGRPDPRLASFTVRSIELAVRLAMRGVVGAVVTPPLNKAVLREAGFRLTGHTEYLAELSGVKRFEMMLVGGNLRVVPVTRHVALKKVAGALTRREVEEAILLTDRELRRSFGIQRPRLVVCGLNPHAGEGGHFGTEETTVIAPAVRSARRKTNARLAGPLSPDALFHDAYLGRYDAEICMYHDQGLIPLKMISRGRGVNVTLGLPFVRTSPDHGTAYDIARAFRADPGSMAEAIRFAVRLSRNRRRYDLAHRGD